MGKTCSVSGCSSSKDKDKSLKLFSFPQPYSEEYRRVVNKCDEQWVPKKNSKICSLHFTKGDINGLKLRPGAVPIQQHCVVKSDHSYSVPSAVTAAARLSLVKKTVYKLKKRKMELERIVSSEHTVICRLALTDRLSKRLCLDAVPDQGFISLVDQPSNPTITKVEQDDVEAEATDQVDTAEVVLKEEMVEDFAEEETCQSNLYQFFTEYEDIEVKEEAATAEEDPLHVDEEGPLASVQPTDPFTVYLNIREDYECNQCLSSYYTVNDLIAHTKSQHEVFRCPIDQCDYSNKRPADLRAHVQSKHLGVRFPCGQCEYAATRKFTLEKHVESIHQGVRFPCAQCNFTATFRSHLTNHIKLKHNHKTFKHQESILQGLRYS